MWEINYTEPSVMGVSPYKSTGKRIINKANAVNEYLKLRKRVRFVGARQGNSVENLEIDNITETGERIAYTETLENFLRDSARTEWVIKYQRTTFFNDGTKAKNEETQRFGSKLKAVERYTDIVNQIIEIGNSIQIFCNRMNYTGVLNEFLDIKGV